MRYIHKDDVARLPKGWDECPSIDATGSVRGMQKLFGWKKGYAFRIGGYIYHLKEPALSIATYLYKG